MNNKTFFIVCVILAVVAVVGIIAYLPAREDIGLKVKVSDFPMTVGEWTAKEMPVEESVYQILATRNLFIREYKNKNGDLLYMYVVYSEDNRKVSHPPEVCLMGGGATLVGNTPVQLTLVIRGNKLLVEKGGARDLIVYWYKAGNFYTDNYVRQQLKVVLARVFGKRTAGAMIRLSTDIKNSDEQSAIKLIQSFTSQIEPLLNKYVP